MSAVHVREELVPLLKDVAARSADFEQQRHISDDIIARFKQIGVYRALVPKAYGGEECSPAQFCELIEQRGAPRWFFGRLQRSAGPPMAPQAGWPALV